MAGGDGDIEVNAITTYNSSVQSSTASVWECGPDRRGLHVRTGYPAVMELRLIYSTAS